MKTDLKILPVSENVKWIGVLDYDIESFDIVMKTEFGTTYNSYFINADKKTIIETSKESFRDTYLEKIRKVCNPSEIEFIVLNHTEPDHSGNLKHLLEIAPNATVVGSGQALNYLSEMLDKPFKSLKVKDGDVLNLGNMKLKIIGAPNLHWPDSIFTYLEEDKVLFTCDSFGAHFCHEEMFDDKVGNYEDAFKYYYDVILQPYSKFMVKAIEKIKDLDISLIAPGHGPILRKNWKSCVEKSLKWSNEYLSKTEKKKRVLIAYVSAYGYTGEMAEKLREGLLGTGELKVDIIDLENMLTGDMESWLVKSDALLVGSPTINQNTLLPGI